MFVYEVGVDSGQISVMPYSDSFNFKYDETDLYKTIEANPGDEVFVSVEYSDQGEWGHRVRQITAKVGRGGLTGEVIGSFRVPANGKLVVSDPCYVLEGDFYGYKEGHKGVPGYDAACHSTYTKENEGVCGAGMFDTGDGMGACCTSGLGDGGYPLHLALDSNGKFSELTVDFFPEGWDDECEEEEQEEDYDSFFF